MESGRYTSREISNSRGIAMYIWITYTKIVLRTRIPRKIRCGRYREAMCPDIQGYTSTPELEFVSLRNRTSHALG